MQQMSRLFSIRLLVLGWTLAMLPACKVLGPDYSRPQTPGFEDWNNPLTEDLITAQAELAQWWTIFDDEDLSTLVEIALVSNNNTEIAALRVLESRAQLGISIGNRYPQAQFAFGDATYVDSANTQGSGDAFWQYGIGASIGWEPDFWGRYRRSIEASDAAFLGSIAAYDQATVLVISQVVDIYTLIRTVEAQLLIAEENLVIQQRSYDIAQVLFSNGEDSELDVQQALTLLLSTQSTIPALDASLRQLLNALNTLLGRAPGSIPEITESQRGIPQLPEQLAIGLPADMLRFRPDVRLAELQAMGQNALVGFAESDLYPIFSLGGSLSLVSGGALVDSDFGDLFSDDAISFAAGPGFSWPFLNYDRIRNNIRVQDARLQQSLISYRESVIQAAREAEDALASYGGAEAQNLLLERTVASAIRSNELSTIRYREGLSDYQRVLDSQKSLFTQQQRLIESQSSSVRSIISLYTALGAGWQNRIGLPTVDAGNLEQMRERTNWGELLDALSEVPDDAGIRSGTDASR
jgi:multidrug efflux system outer membrane protein